MRRRKALLSLVVATSLLAACQPEVGNSSTSESHTASSSSESTQVSSSDSASSSSTSSSSSPDSVSSSSSTSSSGSSSSSSSQEQFGTIRIADNILNGKISFADYKNGDEIPLGTTVEITAHPNEGYVLNTLEVNGEDIFDAERFTVLEPIDYLVTATFVLEAAQVTTATIDLVGISEGGNLQIGMDDVQTDGIELASVTSTGAIFNDDDNTDSDVRLGTGNNPASITFTFAQPIPLQSAVLDVRQYHSDNATVQVTAGDQELEQPYTETEYTFSGDEVESLTIASSGGKNRFIFSGLTLEFGAAAPVVPQPADINISQEGQGTVALEPASDWMTGDTLRVSATPAEGYYVSEVTLNGEAGKRESDTLYTFQIEEVYNNLEVIFRQRSGTDSDFSDLYGNTAIYPDRGSQGDIDAYYEPCRGLKGPALKEALHEIIDDHKEFSYNSLGQDDWETIDVDPFNRNEFYVTYQGPEPMGYSVNREHTWAKSHGKFGTAAPAGSDLHNLRPSNANLNSTRGNNDFGSVPHSTSTSVVDKYSWADESMRGNYVSGGVFEPKDEFKGDVARIIFYMAVRYEGSGEPQLEVEGDIDTSRYYDFTSGASGLHGNFADLYEWATSGLDPVSDYEVNRNNNVDQLYQHNRNPFIDHPEFIIMIYDKSYSGPGALED